MHVSITLPPPDRDQPVEVLLARVRGRLFHRAIGRLDFDAVEDVGLDALLAEQRLHAPGQPELAEVAIGDDEHLAETEPARVEARSRRWRRGRT